MTVPGDVVDEVAGRPRARPGSTPRAGRAGVPATWYPVGATGLRPDEEWQHTDAVPPGHADRAGRAAGRGTARGRPRHRRARPGATRATDPVDVPTLRATLVGEQRRGPRRRRPSTSTTHADGARGRAGGVRRRVRPPRRRDPLADPPTVWCSWYRYFEQVTAADVAGEPAAFDDARPAGRRRPGRRRLEPRPRRGAGRSRPVRVAARGRRRGPRRPAGAPASGWRRSSSAPAPRWPASTPTGWSAPPAATGAQDLVGLDLTHPGVQDLLAGDVRAAGRPGRRLLQARLPLRRRRARAPARGRRRGGGLPRRPGAGPRGGRARRLRSSGCGAPLLPSVGLVDAMRVSPDTFHEGGEDGSAGLRGLMPLAARAWQQGRLWVNDPDCLVARPSYAERERWADAAAALRRAARRSPTGSPSSTTGGWPRSGELLAERRPARPAAGPVRGGAAASRRSRARRDRRDVGGAGRTGSRRTSSCSTPTSTARCCAALVALAERLRRRRCRGARSRAPTAADRLPDHLRRRHPAAGGGAAAHAGRLPATTTSATWSATCTCCRCSRGPPTTASPSSTTARSTPRWARWDDVAELAAEHDG